MLCQVQLPTVHLVGLGLQQGSISGSRFQKDSRARLDDLELPVPTLLRSVAGLGHRLKIATNSRQLRHSS